MRLRAVVFTTLVLYVVGQFAFGDLTLDETLRSVSLFAHDVMPALRAKATRGAEEMAGVAALGRG